MLYVNFAGLVTLRHYDVFEPVGVILFREITAVVPGQPAAFGPFQRSGGA